MTVDPVIAIALSWSLALLLGAAAVHKIIDWSAFRTALESYRLLPPMLVPAAAAVLPVVEASLAAGLVLPAPGAAAATAGLLAVYAVAMAVNLMRHRRLTDCGCGGRRQPLSWILVVRNLLLAVAALGLLLPQAGRALVWLDGVTVAAAVTVASVLYLTADALLAAAQLSEETV